MRAAAILGRHATPVNCKLPYLSDASVTSTAHHTRERGSHGRSPVGTHGVSTHQRRVADGIGIIVGRDAAIRVYDRGPTDGIASVEQALTDATRPRNQGRQYKLSFLSRLRTTAAVIHKCKCVMSSLPHSCGVSRSGLQRFCNENEWRGLCLARDQKERSESPGTKSPGGGGTGAVQRRS